VEHLDALDRGRRMSPSITVPRGRCPRITLAAINTVSAASVIQRRSKL